MYISTITYTYISTISYTYISTISYTYISTITYIISKENMKLSHFKMHVKILNFKLLNILFQKEQMSIQNMKVGIILYLIFQFDNYILLMIDEFYHRYEY